MFRDRLHAGRELVQKLKEYKNTSSNPVVILALPRGALPVAAPIAAELQAPMDILVSKKIGFPGYEEFAIGAVTVKGTRVLNERVLDMYGEEISNEYIERETKRLMKKSKEKEDYLRGSNPAIPLEGKTVILVDDGIATGMTMKAAIEDVSKQNPKKVIVAVPVISPRTLKEFQKMKNLDEIIYIAAPEEFRAVGQFYQSFPQTSDEEAKDILEKSRSAFVPV